MELIATLLLVGAILIALETVLPGLVAGVLGFLCLLAGVVVGYMQYGAQTGHLLLLGVLIGLGVGTMLWLKFFPDSRLGKRFVSQGVVGELGQEQTQLLNRIGIVKSTLRPCGYAVFGGKLVDVVSEGNLIKPGTTVRVIAVQGMRVVVREAETSQN